jgi:flavin reductase (DIM6/NTAB) family NADH-FMN oxidoreductase RutF
VIDRATKRSLGQMIKGVQVVGAAHGGERRLYTSHWVSQVAFDEPVLLASVSPKHDTHPLIVASGSFSVSVLAGDQIAEGQYFSYPGRRFRRLAEEYVEDWAGLPVVPGAISYLRCEVLERREGIVDHDLLLARVVAVREGRLKAPPLLYSSRLGWRVTGDRAREPGTSVRDRLLDRLRALGVEDEPGDDPDDGEAEA